MAGKKNTEKEGSSWVGGIEKYSRKIWLAGLGIYSKIDQTARSCSSRWSRMVKRPKNKPRRMSMT